jgi:hypothetical protein
MIKEFKKFTNENLDLDWIDRDILFFNGKEIEMLEKSGFDIDNNKAILISNDIKIEIEKTDTTVEWSLSYDNIKFEIEYDKTLKDILLYLKNNFNYYINKVERYKKDLEKYNNYNGLKKKLNMKPFLRNVDYDWWDF